MNGFEVNMRKAFQDVKKDILEIKNKLLDIAEKQEKLEINFKSLKK